MVTGCYAQRAPQEIAALPGVTWVVGNSHKHRVAEIAAGPGLEPEVAQSAETDASEQGFGDQGMESGQQNFVSLETVALSAPA